MYSSVRWSKPEYTLYLALKRGGQPRRVQTKYRELHRLAQYARAMPMPVAADVVDDLLSRFSETHPKIRHHHNLHHPKMVCETSPLKQKTDRDRLKCKKKKKRKNRKKHCQVKPGISCESSNVPEDTSPHINVQANGGEGPPESKRSCEEAASDEFCRKQLLNASSKKRKSRIDFDNKDDEEQQPKKRNIKKKSVRKLIPTTDASEDIKKFTTVNEPLRRTVKKKLPSRSLRTTLSAPLGNSSASLPTWNLLSPTTSSTWDYTLIIRPKSTVSPKNAFTTASKPGISMIGKHVEFNKRGRTLEAPFIPEVSTEDTSLLSSPFEASEDPSAPAIDASIENTEDDSSLEDEQTPSSIDYETSMTTMDTTPPERTEDYIRATTPSLFKSLEASSRIVDDLNQSQVDPLRFPFGRLAM